MKEIELKILNEYGLHARPASLLANMASQYTCDIKVVKEESEVNAKSIMNLLLLAAGKDTVIKVTADGPDEDAAISALKRTDRSRKFDEA
jgi:phosphocarrier protein